MYEKCRFELVDEPKCHSSRRFICNNLAEKLIKTLWSNNIDAFRRSLGFNVIDIFNRREQSIVELIKKVFEAENYQSQYSKLAYRIDLYFHEYKLATEVDKYGHVDGNNDYEIQKEGRLKAALNCEFMRINPDEENFNEVRVINEIFRHKKID